MTKARIDNIEQEVNTLYNTIIRRLEKERFWYLSFFVDFSRVSEPVLCIKHYLLQATKDGMSQSQYLQGF
jgi:hypothetical protein